MGVVARGLIPAQLRPQAELSARATTLANTITEAAFQQQVMELLQWRGWIAHHAGDSRRSTAGLPDVVAVHPDHGLLFAELKTERGRLSIEQQLWLDRLAAATGVESKHRGASWVASGSNLVVGLFRPSAFDWLEAVAKGERP